MNNKAKKQKIKTNKQTKKYNRNFGEKHHREMYLTFSTKSKKSESKEKSYFRRCYSFYLSRNNTQKASALILKNNNSS